METAVELTGLYSSYGIFAALGVLSIVVIFLYRKTERLYKELMDMRTNSFEDMKKTALECSSVARESSEAIKSCTDAIAQMNRTIFELKDDIIELRARLYDTKRIRN